MMIVSKAELQQVGFFCTQFSSLGFFINKNVGNRKSFELTSLLVVLQNDFQSRVLNRKYHTEFIEVHKFLFAQGERGSAFSSLRVQLFILHKIVTKQFGTFWDRICEPFIGTLLDTYPFTEE